jgi:anti-anti-sigma factor
MAREPQAFALRGELDLEGSDRVEPALLAYSLGIRGDALVLDCSGLTFLDSSGLGMLVDVSNRTGKRVVLEHVPAQCRRAVELTGLDTVFELA